MLPDYKLFGLNNLVLPTQQRHLTSKDVFGILFSIVQLRQCQKFVLFYGQSSLETPLICNLDQWYLVEWQILSLSWFSNRTNQKRYYRIIS